MKKSNKKQKSMLNIVLAGGAGFGLGSLITLVLNTIQLSKVQKTEYPKYKCNLTASIEPEIEKE